MRTPKILLNATLETIVIVPTHPPYPLLLATVGRPFVSACVTCRHQLPIRQCNIPPILPACDWEILKWSKPTNVIYRASISKEIVPSLIALLNNGCVFGNHFPISHHFPLDWPSSPRLISVLSSLQIGRYTFIRWSPLKQQWEASDSLSPWSKVSGDFLDIQ